MLRNTWMEVNLDDVAFNVRKLKETCGKKIITVIKADAYGCGDKYVATAALEAGTDMFAVSSEDEAFILRNEGFLQPILILGATNPESVSMLIENSISTAAYSMEWIEKIIEKDCAGLRVHLKVDSGMNRIGFQTKEELKKGFDLLKEHGCIVEGIFTHFSCADTDIDFTNRQYAKFREAVEFLQYPFQWIHCDNSDATVFFKDSLTNACRIGVSLYGINTYDHELHYPVSLKTRVILCKHVSEGDKIGYGATYTAQGDEIIATLPIGYADGFIRANQGRKVYIDGSLCEVTGRVCMDQCMVKLDHEVPFDTEAEIFGAHINIEDMAKELHTIPYEILCLISPRVTRRYIFHGKELKEENARIITSTIS